MSVDPDAAVAAKLERLRKDQTTKLAQIATRINEYILSDGFVGDGRLMFDCAPGVGSTIAEVMKRHGLAHSIETDSTTDSLILHFSLTPDKPQTSSSTTSMFGKPFDIFGKPIGQNAPKAPISLERFGDGGQAGIFRRPGSFGFGASS